MSVSGHCLSFYFALENELLVFCQKFYLVKFILEILN